MMAAILTGDSISSRIGLNVREMRGYAYSVSGYFTYGSAGGGFFFSCSRAGRRHRRERA